MKNLGLSLGFFLLLGYGAALQAQEPFKNSLGMEFILIPAGSFTMGMNKETEETDSDALPAHQATISRPFYLGTYEVTQEQWTAIMGDNPSRVKGEKRPVEQVSWDDIQLFIQKLNEKEGGEKYRLPTEAEWEYAARAGTDSAWFFGDDAGSLAQYAWYGNNSGGQAGLVGQKRPSPWGLYDMYGNVWEWVADRYGAKYYRKSRPADPQGPSKGSYRVLRGGGWSNTAMNCRSAFRYYYPPDGRFPCLGFRLAREL